MSIKSTDEYIMTFDDIEGLPSDHWLVNVYMDQVHFYYFNFLFA